MEKIKKSLRRFGGDLLKKIKKPKTILAIIAIWYIETPIIIAFHNGLFKTNLIGVYCNPIKILVTFFTTGKIIEEFIKLNIFIFVIVTIIFSLLHVAGKSTGKIFDLENFERLFKLMEKEEGEVKFSNKGDYGTAKWATEQEISKINKTGYQPYVKLSTDGRDGLIMGYLHNSKKILTLPKKTMLNRNFAVYGSSGSMKSRSFVILNILNMINNEESIFVTDPKGGATRSYLKRVSTQAPTQNIA